MGVPNLASQRDRRLLTFGAPLPFRPIRYSGARIKDHHLVCGLVLPVWQAIMSALVRQHTEQLRQFRTLRVLTTDTERRFIGVAVPDSAKDMWVDPCRLSGALALGSC